MSVRKEIYRFSQGERVWHLTSDTRKVVQDGITYTPIEGLSRTQIEDESIDKCDVDLIFPNPLKILNADGDDLSKVFEGKIYYRTVYLTIMEVFKGQTLVLFKGRVTKPKFDHDEKTMTLVCMTGESLFSRNFNTPVYQRSCSSKVYDRLCGLKFDDWAFECTITSISGLSIGFTVNPTQVKDENGNLVFEPDYQMLDEFGDPVFEEAPILDDFGEPVLDGEGNPTFELVPVMVQGDPVMEVKVYPDGYISNGLFKHDGIWTSVVEHAGGLVKLFMQHIGLKIGDVFLLAPGCDQSLTTCHDRFNNNLRYRGFPNIPNENPTNSKIVK